jgi:hypothetical protein
MTPGKRRQLVYSLERMVNGARMMIDDAIKQLRREQGEDANCDPLVTSLMLVDGTLANAEQGLKTIAKWEAE